MKQNLIRLGRFISFVLRHSPETIKLTLDQNGWADVEELIKNMKRYGKNISKPLLMEIIETNDKKRYELSENGKKIRACQGHTISIELELEEVKPPQILYHGTAKNNMKKIKQNGIKKMKRQHVHLSSDEKTAYNVGQRHGKPYIIKILAEKMYEDGQKFYLSKNEVWLTNDIAT